MSTVYPVARGCAPVLVLVVGVLLGTHVGWLPALGAALVVAGILLVRSPAHASASGVLMALAVGACIAGYTLIDAHGVDHASVAAYLLAVLGLTALAQVAIASRAGACAT